ncbi:hypothetical protein ACFL6U_21940 [Planctomycetota bacterium]
MKRNTKIARKMCMAAFASCVLVTIVCGEIMGGELVASSESAFVGTWPQWRGPQRDGWVGDSDWPTGLTETQLLQQWRQPIGDGYSGPIVSETQVFTFETKDKKEEIVRAFDRKTGALLWDIDGYLYLHRRDRRFCCIDLANQKITWTSKPRFGQYVSLVTNGKQILGLDQKGELLLIDANPESFVLRDRRSVAKDSWAHLAVVDDQVFVRELQAISAYRWHIP